MSIILGAISLLIFGVWLGLAAIIVGAYAESKEDKRGRWGIILGIIGAAAAAVILYYGWTPFTSF